PTTFHGQQRQAAARAASVFDKGVFQVQLQDVRCKRRQRFDKLLVPRPEADDRDLQPIADAPGVDQAVAGRKGRRLTGEFQDDLPERELEIVGGTIDPQYAVDEDPDAVSNALDVSQNVRAEQNRPPFALDDLNERLKEIAAHNRIQ